ncbi:hypothetical protein HanPI659440_Chr13g0510681 [Helianthus annuus]|nr:hypothetical protein HanPI659440_Chr13g0510681 [Helianthus annuus]
MNLETDNIIEGDQLMNLEEKKTLLDNPVDELKCNLNTLTTHESSEPDKERRKSDAKYDQFYLGDYRPLIQDGHGNALDQLAFFGSIIMLDILSSWKNAFAYSRY